MSTKRPPTPRRLGSGGRKLWLDIVGAFEIEPHEVAALEAACLARDRLLAAQDLIDAEGLVIEGRYGAKAHPAVAVVRDSSRLMLAALKDLGLEEVAPVERARTWKAKPGPKPKQPKSAVLRRVANDG